MVLCLWVFSSLAPSLVYLIVDNTDNIEVTRNIEEDPQEEKKDTSKDWIFSDTKRNYNIRSISEFLFYYNGKGCYQTPNHEVILPPPEIV